MEKIRLKQKRTSTTIVKDNIFFYQNARSLEFVVWQKGYDGKSVCVQFKLPLSKLGI